ncbi:maleylpyruvate isomerase family mycothiol-dependent enzyme [Actinoallomurus sp. CA-142502]|uniref:maleylpyruvate isomerase family mycothiol-dependent enzyme n=1 Tax=Actinoallomurus sp. CA-142502 TaxID=3239885 RepID=UPI003D93944B
MTDRPREAEAFLTALQDLPPNALSTCDTWTVHHIGAHLAGNHEEALRHVETYAQGSPLTSTRSVEEREPPFRELSGAALLKAVERYEERMRRAVAAVLADDPDAEPAWTGRPFKVGSFSSHMRNECAIHRWDSADVADRRGRGAHRGGRPGRPAAHAVGPQARPAGRREPPPAAAVRLLTPVRYRPRQTVWIECADARWTGRRRMVGAGSRVRRRR